MYETADHRVQMLYVPHLHHFDVVQMDRRLNFEINYTRFVGFSLFVDELLTAVDVEYDVVIVVVVVWLNDPVRCHRMDVDIFVRLMENLLNVCKHRMPSCSHALLRHDKHDNNEMR